MIVNLAIGCITPPFGYGLFMGARIADVSMHKIIKPILPYMINASYATIDYNVPFTRKAIGIVALLAVLGGGIAVSLFSRNKKS